MADNFCLDKAVSDYLLWLIDAGYAESTIYRYERTLIHFQNHIGSSADSLDVILNNETIATYENESTLKDCTVSVWGLAKYLFRQEKLTELPSRTPKNLPVLYETYLSESQTNGLISAQPKNQESIYN